MEKCLEVCVDSYKSALNAINGGADRLELCTCLLAGGLTPDPVLLEHIKKESNIEIRCLMRPRFGDFLYDDSDVEIMAEQIRRLIDSGADGFVIGCLRPEGVLDLRQMEKLINAANGKKLTLHRAIDVSKDGIKTAKQAEELGIDTVLTSGQAANCWEGREFIRKLLDEELKLTIMPGAGVNADVIRRMRAIMPLGTFHMSGKETLRSNMKFRREGVPMGLPGIDEFTLWQTSENEVRKAAEALRAK